MNVDLSEQALRQLRAIKWLLSVAVGCLVVFAGSIVWMSMEIWESSTEIARSSETVSLSEQLNDLLEKGKASEVLTLVAEREKTHPMDPNVHWYRGRAHQQLGQNQEALKAMQRTLQVAPNWKREYIDPYLEAINADIGRGK